MEKVYKYYEIAASEDSATKLCIDTASLNNCY